MTQILGCFLTNNTKENFGLVFVWLLISWLGLNNSAPTCILIHWKSTHITSFCLHSNHMFITLISVMCWLMQATAEANNLAAVASAKDQYYKNMEKVSMWLGITLIYLVSMKKSV